MAEGNINPALRADAETNHLQDLPDEFSQVT